MRATCFGVIAVGIMAGCGGNKYSETILLNTKVSGSGAAAAFFERSTHATVANTYVLKMKGSDSPEWVAVGVFQHIKRRGKYALPSLRMEGTRLDVTYGSADVRNFDNRVWLRSGKVLAEFSIRLIEEDR